MLHTVVSSYDIFCDPKAGGTVIKIMNIPGGKVEYTVSGKNKVVKSLFSTDPRLYLDKRYIPGARL